MALARSLRFWIGGVGQKVLEPLYPLPVLKDAKEVDDAVIDVVDRLWPLCRLVEDNGPPTEEGLCVGFTTTRD